MAGNIREYTNPVNGLQLDDRASNAYAYAGRSIEQSYSDLGRSLGGLVKDAGQQYAQHEARKDISEGSARAVVMQSYLNEQWAKKTAETDLNDGTTPDVYRQEVLEPTLENFVNSFKTEAGQDWARQQVGQIRQHMFEKTAADQATRSGAAVGQNLDVMANYATNVAMADPTSLNHMLGLVDNAVNAQIALSPDLTPAQQASLRGELTTRMRSQITQAAGLGMAEANPEAAKAAFATGAFAQYLTAQEVAALDNHADTVIRQNQEQTRQDAAEQRRVQVQEANQVSTQISAGMVGPDGRMHLPTDFYQQLRVYAALPGADDGTVRALEGAAQSAIREDEEGMKAVDDPATYSSFVGRLGIPQGQPGALSQMEIHQARGAGKLSEKSWSFLLRATEEDKSDPAVAQMNRDLNTFFDGAKPLIDKSNPLMGQIDGTGATQYARFQLDMQAFIAAKRQSGMTPAEIEQRYLRAGSPESIERFIPRYVNSTAQSRSMMNNFLQGNPQSVPYTGIFQTAPATGPAAAPAFTVGTPAGLVTPGNINLNNRPRVQNADGSVSTVRSITITQDHKAILIPTVSDDGKVMSNADAIKQYQTTGRHLGVFGSEAQANAYAQSLHQQQAATLAPGPSEPVPTRRPGETLDALADRVLQWQTRHPNTIPNVPRQAPRPDVSQPDDPRYGAAPFAGF